MSSHAGCKVAKNSDLMSPLRRRFLRRTADKSPKNISAASCISLLIMSSSKYAQDHFLESDGEATPRSVDL
jgi:hypothetical protein